jgi:hypothetical protein
MRQKYAKIAKVDLPALLVSAEWVVEWFYLPIFRLNAVLDILDLVRKSFYS